MNTAIFQTFFLWVFQHFTRSNLSTDHKCPKCIYKISKNFRVEKSGEIFRNLRSFIFCGRIFFWPHHAGYSPAAKIRTPCARRASSPIFGRRMRTDAFALQMLGKSYASQPRQRAPGWVPFALAGMAGFGPTNVGVKVLCLTAWRHPNNTVIISHLSRDVNEKSHKTAVKSKKPCLWAS